MTTLTERQNKLYRFVCSFFIKNHCLPTYREIALAMGIASKTGVRNHLELIQAKGLISLRGGLGEKRAETRAWMRFERPIFTPLEIN